MSNLAQKSDAPVAPPDKAALTPPFAGHWLSSPGASDEWDRALAAARSVPPTYVRSFGEYQAAYVSERCQAYVDLSVVMRADNRPVAVWPLAAALDDRGWRLTSHEAPILPPLLCVALPEKSEKRLLGECFDLLTSLASHLGISELVTAEPVRENRCSLFHQLLMERGARVTTTHTLGVDLSLDLEAIRLRFRSRFRPLITKGLATWEAAVLQGLRTPIFEEFRSLHREVAGRVTRCARTWELQHDALEHNEAFLVTLRTKDTGRMVGAGLFNVSRTDGLYAVGAYDRSLFPLPLGHAVQYKAIEHMKKLGLSWYWLGPRPFPQDDPPPTDKEAQIGFFKLGFATHMQPVFTLRSPASYRAPEPGAPEEAP